MRHKADYSAGFASGCQPDYEQGRALISENFGKAVAALTNEAGRVQAYWRGWVHGRVVSRQPFPPEVVKAYNLELPADYPAFA